MSTRSLHVNPTFRVEHLGSLIRPAELIAQRVALSKGQITKEELRKAEDSAIKDVVALQLDAGVKVLSDGEFRRMIFTEGVMDALNGVENKFRPFEEWRVIAGNIQAKIEAGLKGEPSYFAHSQISRARPMYKDHFLYLKSIVPPELVKNIKITMPTPSWYHRRHGSRAYDPAVYANDREYFEGLAAAYREEIDELYSLGCRIIQIDDPLFCFGCDESVRARVRDIEGTDPVEEVQLYIEAINMITKDRPDDLVIGLHMCRGNWPTAAGAKAAYFTGSYNWLATEGRVFERLDVDALYLEFDSDRCGDFTPLATVQKNKMIVLGLVTTKDPKMESKQELKDRIFEAVSAMSAEGSGRSKEEALNQLAISPQCGFSSIAMGYPLSIEEQKQKLELLVEVSKMVWGDA